MARTDLNFVYDPGVPGSIDQGDLYIGDDGTRSVVRKLIEEANSGITFLSSLDANGNPVAEGSGYVTLGLNYAEVNPTVEPLWENIQNKPDFSNIGNGNYINNGTARQTSANFNIDGIGKVGKMAIGSTDFNPDVMLHLKKSTPDGFIWLEGSAPSLRMLDGNPANQLNIVWAGATQTNNYINGSIPGSQVMINYYGDFLMAANALNRGHVVDFKVSTSGNTILGGLVDNGNKFQVNGGASISSLVGTGSRMVIADANGVLSTQPIPTGTTYSGADFIQNRTVAQGYQSGSFAITGTGEVNGLFTIVNSTDGTDTAVRLKTSDGGMSVGQELRMDWMQINTVLGRQAMVYNGNGDWGFNFYGLGGGTLNNIMSMRGNGNILIGTTINNGSKLQVNGTSTFSGDMRVDGKLNIGQTGYNPQYLWYSLDGYIGSSGSFRSSTGNYYGATYSSAAKLNIDYYGHSFSAGQSPNGSRVGLTYDMSISQSIANNYDSRVLSMGYTVESSHSAANTIRGGYFYVTDKSNVTNTIIGVSADVSGGTNTNAKRYTFYGVGGTLYNSGKVMIGTTFDQGYKLQVEGTGSFTHVVSSYYGLSSVNTGFYQSSVNDITFQNNGTDAMTIYNNQVVTMHAYGKGNIMNGTPEYLLAVDFYGNLMEVPLTNSGGVNPYILPQAYNMTFRNNDQQPYDYFGQVVGNNDGWKIYGEGTDNQGSLVLQVDDDGTENIIMRFKVSSGGGSSAAPQHVFSKNVVNWGETLWYQINGLNRFRFDGNGDFYVYNDVIGFATTTLSDARLKTNVQKIESPMDKIMRLNGVTFEWLESLNRPGREIGFIAQEVEEVLPELVREKETLNGNMKTVDYPKLVALLVEGMKEQQKQIDELKSIINK
jgi:hypothetical protein